MAHWSDSRESLIFHLPISGLLGDQGPLSRHSPEGNKMNTFETFKDRNVEDNQPHFPPHMFAPFLPPNERIRATIP